MTTKIAGTVVKEAVIDKAALARIPVERRQFRDLILTNPNYFGTLKTSLLTPIVSMSGNTTYEDLGCIGYNPETEQLHAVIHVKQPYGYVSGLCGAGSPEYVRFFIQDQATGTWTDQGLTQAVVHDMAHAGSLNYSVTLQINPAKKPCTEPNLLKVKAILSWNDAPTDADFIPVWGEIKEVTIQVRPMLVLHFDPGQFGLKLPIAKIPGLNDVIFPKVAPPVHDWQMLLQTKAAEPGRVAVSMKSYLSMLPQTSTTGISKMLESMPDVQKALGGLAAMPVSQTYEELTCVGLNQDLNTLVATLRVKQPSGYMGGLCGAGSREYVAFWVDWNNGHGWTYAGTNSVKVHDIAATPEGGIHYAVSLPINTLSYTAPCTAGPKVYKVRAILSWELPPSTVDPDWTPYWGNMREENVQVKPGPAVPMGVHKPFMETVGGMAVTSINASGLANGPAVMAGFTATDSPFGGLVVFTGHISNPPALGDLPLKYRIMISDDNGVTWQPLTTKFPIWISQFNGLDWIGPNKEMQAPDDHGWYTYKEALANQYVAGNVLAWWYTQPQEGIRKLRMDVKEPDGDIILGTEIVTVCLDNTAPQISFVLDTPTGQCGTYAPNAEITGNFTVTDDHLGSFGIHVDPDAMALTAVATYDPVATSYPSVTTTGDGTFKVTGLMDPCGYVLTMQAWDRTIVNSGAVGYYNNKSVGLCVRQA